MGAPLLAAFATIPDMASRQPSMSIVSEPTIRHRPDENVSSFSPVTSAPSPAPSPGRLVVDAQTISLTCETADGRVDALSGVSLQIAEGEFVSFIGPSGCGKTTMLRVVADLQQPSSGTLLVNGMSAENARLARSYGYVFQAPALFPWRTIEKNLKLPLEIMGFSEADQQQRVERYLSLVNLTGFERKFPWQLSGGMQQRVSIARALSFDPAMLLMDEPFGALDEIVRDHLNEQLLQLWKSTEKTVLFVTHSIPEAVFLSTKIAVMSPLARHHLGERYAPLATTILALVAIWYVAALAMNWTLVRDGFEREETPYTVTDVLSGTMSAERPLLPAPHQVVAAFLDGVFGYPPLAPRSLVYHSLVTLSATLLGFVLGALFGILLALMSVHSRVLERSLLPWIICSQMVPVLALAPIFIVVLGALGLHGLLPKSIISAYLCFFPIAIGMVKGFTSPDPLQIELMQTWSATPRQMLWKLRWPAAIPYLFTSLKVAITISLVGAIVAELPTGAEAGIGARLLAGSYYGQTVQLWAALVASAVLSSGLIGLVGLIEPGVARRMGAH